MLLSVVMTIHLSSSWTLIAASFGAGFHMVTFVVVGLVMGLVTKQTVFLRAEPVLATVVIGIIIG